MAAYFLVNESFGEIIGNHIGRNVGARELRIFSRIVMLMWEADLARAEAVIRAWTRGQGQRRRSAKFGGICL